MTEHSTSRGLLSKSFLDSSGRLRLFWRLCAHGALALAGIVILTLPVVFFGLLLGADTVDLSLSLTSPGWAIAFLLPGVIGLTLATAFARRALDRRSIRSLGLGIDRRLALDLLVGFVISGGMMGVIYAAETGFGWVRIEGFAWESAVPTAVLSLTAATFIQFLLAGYQEELLSRGYHLQNLAENFGPRVGIVVSSLIFALLHLANPSSGWASTLGITAAGILLAFAAFRSKRLWLSVGIHTGWNFFEGTVFGFPVSGLDFFRLTKITVSGPPLITGGAFGPEAGLIVLPAIALGAGAVWLYTRRPTT